MVDDFTRKLAQDIAEILNQPTENKRRQMSVQELMNRISQEVQELPSEMRFQLVEELWEWCRKKNIPGHTIKSDDETIDWLEEIIGTIDGIASDLE